MRVLCTRLVRASGEAAVIECRTHANKTMELELGLGHIMGMLEEVRAVAAERAKSVPAAKPRTSALIVLARSRACRIAEAAQAAIEHGPFQPHGKRAFWRSLGLREDELVMVEREMHRRLALERQKKS